MRHCILLYQLWTEYILTTLFRKEKELKAACQFENDVKRITEQLTELAQLRHEHDGALGEIESAERECAKRAAVNTKLGNEAALEKKASVMKIKQLEKTEENLYQDKGERFRLPLNCLSLRST